MVRPWWEYVSSSQQIEIAAINIYNTAGICEWERGKRDGERKRLKREFKQDIRQRSPKMTGNKVMEWVGEWSYTSGT